MPGSLHEAFVTGQMSAEKLLDLPPISDGRFADLLPMNIRGIVPVLIEIHSEKRRSGKMPSAAVGYIAQLMNISVEDAVGLAEKFCAQSCAPGNN
ncbi:hypothetical protein FACS189449_05830 [Alphaproteobacteria bacterium]|nr:hypothetical protein FACS189449_05830 [Alphaproteobacteria bacterium]